MSLEQIRSTLPAYAQDIKLNLGNVMGSEDSPLSVQDRHRIALASAFAARNQSLAQALEQEGRANGLQDVDVHAARVAVSLMAMNNVYYRFLHLSHDPELNKLPAKLRMQGMASPAVGKKEFELMALAVSAINGCGMCIEAHNRELLKHGVEHRGLQEVARVAAVINATAQVLALAP